MGGTPITVVRSNVQLSPNPFKAFNVKTEVPIESGVPEPASTTVCSPVVVKVLIWLKEMPFTVFVVIQKGPTILTSTVIDTVLALVSAVSATYLPEILAAVQLMPVPMVYTAKITGLPVLIFVQPEKKMGRITNSRSKVFI